MNALALSSYVGQGSMLSVSDTRTPTCTSADRTDVRALETKSPCAPETASTQGGLWGTPTRGSGPFRSARSWAKSGKTSRRQGRYHLATGQLFSPPKQAQVQGPWCRLSGQAILGYHSHLSNHITTLKALLRLRSTRGLTSASKCVALGPRNRLTLIIVAIIIVHNSSK